MYFFDTNVCIYLLKGLFLNLQRKMIATKPSNIKIAAMVVAELIYGAKKSQKEVETLKKIALFLKPLKVIPFDMEAAGYYGAIRAALEKKGTPIGHNDLVIAATVLAHNGILVTNNVSEFSRIKGLRLENWV